MVYFVLRSVQPLWTQREATDTKSSSGFLMEADGFSFFFPPLFWVWKVRAVFITGSYFCPWRIRVSPSKCTRITLTSRKCLTETFATRFSGKFGISFGRWSQDTVKKHTFWLCSLNKHICFFFHFASGVAINAACNSHIQPCQMLPAFYWFYWSDLHRWSECLLRFNEQKLVQKGKEEF